MKIDEFLRLYKVNNKVAQNHIKNIYIPIEEKQTRANNIITSTHYQDDENGVRQFRANSVAMYMLTALSLLDMYTDIERGDNVLEDFNKLNEVRFFDEIREYVDDDELDEFANILEMEQKDLLKNEYEIGGFIRNQIGRLASVLQNTLPPLLAQLDLDKLSAFLNEYKATE